MTLHLLQLRPDPRRLAAFALDRKALPPGGDLGYAVHLVLTQSFGAAAPKPFRYFEEQGQLLAYAAEVEPLREALALPASDERARLALGLETPADLEAKAMPEIWRPGARYGFEVRLRPVRRYGRPTGPKSSRERDAFLAAIEGQADKTVDRREVYLEWTAEQLAKGGARPAEPSDWRLQAMRRTRVRRRNRASIEGPDIVVAGTLEVTDPESFAAGIARGLGRHRAFGFGMLLLRPPG